MNLGRSFLTFAALGALAFTGGCGPDLESAELGALTVSPAEVNLDAYSQTATPVSLSAADFSCANCRGPKPSIQSVEALAGPFAIETLEVTQTSGAPATIYYPTAAGKPYAAVVIMPGLGGSRGEFEWLGRRLASNGFVTMTIDTPLKAELAPIRAPYFKQAFDQLASLSRASGNVLSGRIDPDRIGAMGHSAGGGAVLLFARDNPGLPKAIMPLSEGGDLTFSYSFTTPAMFFTCRDDLLAVPAVESLPDYNSLPGHKAYIEAQGGNFITAHNCVLPPVANQAKIGKYAVSWMKLWLDRDWRYHRFICGADNPRTDADFVVDYRSTCPA